MVETSLNSFQNQNQVQNCGSKSKETFLDLSEQLWISFSFVVHFSREKIIKVSDFAYILKTYGFEYQA